jgi:hypothetical protein
VLGEDLAVGARKGIPVAHGVDREHARADHVGGSAPELLERADDAGERCARLLVGVSRRRAVDGQAQRAGDEDAIPDAQRPAVPHDRLERRTGEISLDWHPPFCRVKGSRRSVDPMGVARVDPHAHQALRASAAGLDADPWLRAFLEARRTSGRLDAAGIVALGLDGRARVRAWSGRGATRIAQALVDPWPGGEPVPAEALARLGLGSATLTECGSRALLVAARRGGSPPAALHAEPLIDALLAVEQGRAATKALGAAAAICATRSPAEVWRAASRTLEQRFATGQPASIAVPGTSRRLDARSAGVADEAALAAIADLVAIALGRGQVQPAA